MDQPKTPAPAAPQFVTRISFMKVVRIIGDKVAERLGDQ
jgi:hypothetical protein